MNKGAREPVEEFAPPARIDCRCGMLTEGTKLADAIRCLNESSLQIALVVAPDQTLLGTLTDGDIRRGLLRGMHLESLIDPIIYREPLVVPPLMGRETVLQLMQANKIHQLPVVDGDRRLVGLHLWDELMLPTERANWMVIMAGGRGTRLHPHTEHCPKPMLPVGGKPMLEHILERAKGDGFTHFVIAIHFLGHMIEEYFGNGSRWRSLSRRGSIPCPSSRSGSWPCRGSRRSGWHRRTTRPGTGAYPGRRSVRPSPRTRPAAAACSVTHPPATG